MQSRVFRAVAHEVERTVYSECNTSFQNKTCFNKLTLSFQSEDRNKKTTRRRLP
jgi:hypothetical protein